MPERLECEVLQKARYINTLTYTFTFLPLSQTHILGQNCAYYTRDFMVDLHAWGRRDL